MSSDCWRRPASSCAIIARDPARPNLLARLPGRGAAPPLLLQGHVDVVTTARPGSGAPALRRRDRRRLDLGPRRARHEGRRGDDARRLAARQRRGHGPAGRRVAAAGQRRGKAAACYGANFLVEEHAELFAGVRYALGEFGGFDGPSGGPAASTRSWSRRSSIAGCARPLRGPGGHGSLPMRGGAMGKLGRLLARARRARGCRSTSRP